jgi:hypothetical protein
LTTLLPPVADGRPHQSSLKQFADRHQRHLAEGIVLGSDVNMQLRASIRAEDTAPMTGAMGPIIDDFLTLRPNAGKGRFRCINHVALDCSRSVVSTRLGSKAQGTINIGCDTGGKNAAAVQHHAFGDRSGTEERQQVKRRPMSRCSASLQRACCGANHGSGADGENAASPGRLLSNPNAALLETMLEKELVLIFQ